MTQAEAIQAMKEGKKVKHMRFKIGEYITMENGSILDDNGKAFLPFDYWKQRKLSYFNEFWEIKD